MRLNDVDSLRKQYESARLASRTQAGVPFDEIDWAHLAHSVKNVHIKHYLDTDGRYRCFGCCAPTPEKCTRYTPKVTCKNCLKKILW